MLFVCSIPIIYYIDWNQLLNTSAISNDELKLTLFLGLFIFTGEFVLRLISTIWINDRINVPFVISIAFTIYAILNVLGAPFNNFLTGIGKLNFNMIINAVKIGFFISIVVSLVKWNGSVGMVYAIILVNLLPMIIFGWLQYNAVINNKAKGVWNR